MSITVQWDNPDQTILHWDFVGHWDWNEFLVAQQRTIDLMRSVPHRVHVIVDVSQSPSLPPGALGRLHSFRRSETPNAGRVVLVGMNQFIRTAVTMFLRIFPADWGTVVFATSLDHARKLLADST